MTSSYIQNNEPFTIFQIDRLLPTILIDEHSRHSPLNIYSHALINHIHYQVLNDSLQRRDPHTSLDKLKEGTQMKGQVKHPQARRRGPRTQTSETPLHLSTKEPRKVEKHDIYNSRRCSPKFQGSLIQIVRFRKKNRNVPAKNA